jgi:hypothetical protein
MKAVVIFFEEGEEFKEFETKSGVWDLCDVIRKFKFQYLHFNQPAKVHREIEALTLISMGQKLNNKCILCRCENLEEKNEL